MILPDWSTEAEHGLGGLRLRGPYDVAGGGVNPFIGSRQKFGEEVVNVVGFDG
jgi:hypothetical protein